MDVWTHHSTISCNSYFMGLSGITRIGLPINAMQCIITTDDNQRGGNNDNDGGTTYSRGRCTYSQVKHHHCQGNASSREDRRFQDWQAVESQARITAALYRRAVTTARQKITGTCQPNNEISVAWLLPLVVQTADNSLSTRYLFVYCTVHCTPKSIAQYTCNGRYGWHVR